MHNLNYIELANEALPEETYRGALFNDVRITYKKEIKLGDTVKCKYAYQQDKHIVVVKSSDESVVHAIIEKNKCKKGPGPKLRKNRPGPFLHFYIFRSNFNNLYPLKVKSITSLIKIEIIYPLKPRIGTRK